LPDAFLRRCIFHYIDFPDRELMARIVDVHHPGLDRDLLDQALSAFFAVRGMDRIRKPPSTSELVDWIAMLQTAGVETVDLDDAPFLGTLLKKEQDMEAFFNRTSRRF
jgi:MoxR-like ATPase